jgi:hypothetical protein
MAEEVAARVAGMPVHGRLSLATRDIKKGTTFRKLRLRIESRGVPPPRRREKPFLSGAKDATIDTSMASCTCRVGGILQTINSAHGAPEAPQLKHLPCTAPQNHTLRTALHRNIKEGGGLLLDYKWGALMMDACQAVQLLIGNQQGLRSPFAGHRPRLGPLCLRHSHPWRFPPRRWTAHCSMVASGEGWKVMSLGAHRRGERQTHPPQLSSSSTPSAQRGHLDFLGTEKP